MWIKSKQRGPNPGTPKYKTTSSPNQTEKEAYYFLYLTSSDRPQQAGSLAPPIPFDTPTTCSTENQTVCQSPPRKQERSSTGGAARNRILELDGTQRRPAHGAMQNSNTPSGTELSYQRKRSREKLREIIRTYARSCRRGGEEWGAGYVQQITIQGTP